MDILLGLGFENSALESERKEGYLDEKDPFPLSTGTKTHIGLAS